MPGPSSGLYGLVFNVIAGCLLVITGLALACILLGAIGQRWARRHGRQCPHCDYRAGQADMLIHRVLEHED